MFPENQLRLPAAAAVFPIVTPFSLCIERVLALLLWGHLVKLVLATVLTEALVGLGAFVMFAGALSAQKETAAEVSLVSK